MAKVTIEDFKLVQEKKLSLTEIANKSGMSKQAVSQMFKKYQDQDQENKQDLAKSLLGIFDWCKRQNMPLSICDGVNQLLNTVYNEIKLSSEKEIIINKNKGLKVHENKKGPWFDNTQLIINDKIQTFKSLTAAYIHLINYLCKKHNKIIVRNLLNNCVKSIHNQLILKGGVPKGMGLRYKKVNEGYLYINLSSTEKIKRINHLIKELKENISLKKIKE